MPSVQRCCWLAFAVLALAQPLAAASAPAAPAAAAETDVRLVAPADGAVLTGGSTATFAWEPGPGMDVADAHEWEAFVSLDGGATWPVRITPHLDLDVRRVSFPVPALPSDDVRFLLRVGDDERDETAYEVPGTFSIEGAPGAVLPAAEVRYGEGETALAGGDGVVGWVEGSSLGGGRRNVVALPLTRGMHGLQPPLPGSTGLPAETESHSARTLGAARGPAIGTVPVVRVAATRPRPSPPGSRDILLLIDRLDE